MLIEDPSLQSIDVNKTGPAFLKDESYFGDFEIIVGAQYSFKLTTIYANGYEAMAAFGTTDHVDMFAMSVPSDPLSVSVCSHTQIVTSEQLCSPHTPAPYTVYLTFENPADAGIGARHRLTMQLKFDIDIAEDDQFLRTVNESRNLVIGNPRKPYLVELSDIPHKYKGATLYARVRAFNHAGVTEWVVGSGAAFIVGRSNPPVVTTASLVSDANYDGAYITVTVSIPSDTGSAGNTLIPVLAYEVQASRDASFTSYGRAFSVEGVTLAQFEPGPVSYRLTTADQLGNDDSKLKIGNEYFIRVRARTYLGNGEFSPVVSKWLACGTGKYPKLVPRSTVFTCSECAQACRSIISPPPTCRCS